MTHGGGTGVRTVLDSAPSDSEYYFSDDSERVLAQLPNRAARVGVRDFGGNSPAPFPGGPKLFGKTPPATLGRRTSTGKLPR